MIKVFEDFDVAKVGHYQSVLQAHGIETFIKNQFGTSGAGELPFVEVVPQLWVLNRADAGRAGALIAELQAPAADEAHGDWTCGVCGTPQAAVFSHCWRCSAARP